MRNDILEEVELDFYGFKRTITVNSQPQRLCMLMYNSLHLPIEIPCYWVFVKTGRGKYTFDHISDINFSRG